MNNYYKELNVSDLSHMATTMFTKCVCVCVKKRESARERMSYDTVNRGPTMAEAAKFL